MLSFWTPKLKCVGLSRTSEPVSTVFLAQHPLRPSRDWKTPRRKFVMPCWPLWGQTAPHACPSPCAKSVMRPIFRPCGICEANSWRVLPPRKAKAVLANKLQRCHTCSGAYCLRAWDPDPALWSTKAPQRPLNYAWPHNRKASRPSTARFTLAPTGNTTLVATWPNGKFCSTGTFTCVRSQSTTVCSLKPLSCGASR